MSFQQALSGLNAASRSLDVIGHNIANAGTTGMKSSRAEFAEIYASSAGAIGGTNVGLGVGVADVSQQFSQGSLSITGNDLDVAINGNGFFQIQMPDGTVAYTRDGSFKTDANGQLVTNNGYLVAPGLTVPPNTQSLTVAPDGTVSATVQGSAQPVVLGNLQLASFVNPGGLEPRGQNLFVETAASGTPTTNAPGSDGLGTLQQGYLETSNVNVVEELVAMIQTQRAYELNSKAIQTSDQMLQRLAQL